MVEVAGIPVAYLALGLLAGLLVELLVFWAGCALADFEAPGVVRSLAVVTPAYAASMILLIVLVSRFGLGEASASAVGGSAWSFSRIALLALASLAVNVVLAGVLYIALLTRSLGKGFLIAGTEVVLRVLMTVLIIAVVLVVLAGVQIYRGDRPQAGWSLPPGANGTGG